MMFSSKTASSASICGAALMLLALASCSDTGDDRYRPCPGYRDDSTCMSMRRHHRDREQLMNQEKALINAAQARENLRMLREIRRKRGEY
jgi:hypothetical protein